MALPQLELAHYYYYLKPFIPRRMQLAIRRFVALRKRARCKDVWPIDPKAGTPPCGWAGWPGKKRFGFILTHDVDTSRGHDRCHQLMELEKSLGFRSSFNFVAGEYNVSADLLRHLEEEGFEVGIHGLVHSREMYRSKAVFMAHALEINRRLDQWGAVGFRSPCMYHNLDWLQSLDIDYDSSTFDTDPFEPQPEGAGTIFPFKVEGATPRNSYIELPYTLAQDFTLFVLFQERNVDVWKEKLAWIAEHGGMALLNTHPDYMNFGGPRVNCDEYSVDLYREFLVHVKEEYKEDYFHVLPKEVARLWRHGYSVTSQASAGVDEYRWASA